MADVWGGVTLNILDYSRPAADIFMTEKLLLSDPLSTLPQTLLMGSGRQRKRRSVRGWAYKADFDELETDYYSCTSKTISFKDGFSMSAYIEKLEGELKQGSSLVWYTATFIEA